MEEIWKDVDGFEGMYSVSTHGRVMSLSRLVTHSDNFKRLRAKRILKTRLSIYGYALFYLCRDGVSKDCRVHRVIAQIFIPNPENKPYVNHIDGDKLNNRVENLEWCTHLENMRHASITGLRERCKGELNCNSVLNNEQVKEIKEIIKGNNLLDSQIAKKYFVSKGTIAGIRRGDTWKHINI